MNEAISKPTKMHVETACKDDDDDDDDFDGLTVELAAAVLLVLQVFIVNLNKVGIKK